MCPDNKLNWAGDEFVFNDTVSYFPKKIPYNMSLLVHVIPSDAYDKLVHMTLYDMMPMTSLYISLLLRVIAYDKICSLFILFKGSRREACTSYSDKCKRLKTRAKSEIALVVRRRMQSPAAAHLPDDIVPKPSISLQSRFFVVVVAL